MRKLLIVLLFLSNLAFANEENSKKLFQETKEALSAFMEDLIKEGYLKSPDFFFFRDGTILTLGVKDFAIMTDGKEDCSIHSLILKELIKKQNCTVFPAKDNAKTNVTFQSIDGIKKSEVWTVDYKNNRFSLIRPNGFKVSLMKAIDIDIETYEIKPKESRKTISKTGE